MRRPYVMYIYSLTVLVLPSLFAFNYLSSVAHVSIASAVCIGMLYLQASLLERAVRYEGVSRYMRVEDRKGILIYTPKPGAMK